MSRDITISLWNANGLSRHTAPLLLHNLFDSSLIFLTETWLLSPLRYPIPKEWKQLHNYGSSVDNSDRGQQGISLLVNPKFPYPVTHIPTSSPYVLTCHISSLVIHCLYLPPSLPDDAALEILRSLEINSNANHTNTLICGDLNARHESLLGDTKTTTRGGYVSNWLLESGLRCWNAKLAFGIPTYCNPKRLTRTGEPYKSVIDLMITSGNLIHPRLTVRLDLAMGSDHHPVSLSFVLPRAPPPPPKHPRLLWNLGKLKHKDCKFTNLFADRVKPLHEKLKLLVTVDNSPGESDASGLSGLSGSSGPPGSGSGSGFGPGPGSGFSSGIEADSCPDMNALSDELCDTITSSLDDSVGRSKPLLSGQSWFWNTLLQDRADYREDRRRLWRNEPDAIMKAIRFADYEAADYLFKLEVKRRKRETWKQFCSKLSDGPFAETADIIKRVRRNRVITPRYSHVDGPAAAALTMSQHLQTVFSGSFLPPVRQPVPPKPEGPHLFVFPDDIEAKHECPINEDTVLYYLTRRLARRKAPGVDHLRTEILLPISKYLVPVVSLLFRLCWKWSVVPRSWCTAQVVPIYKKGSPLDPGNFRPISLTSVLRKWLELCLQDTLTETAPKLDIVQGGFRANRSAMDQALCLNEICHQHTLDHYGEPPTLAFLDIKSAYDTVDRAIIWRALETHVSAPMLGLLQSLFDSVQIEVVVLGETSPGFSPATGVLQGSILSPFLYSVYINSLPAFLRTTRLPINRAFDSVPRRLFDGLWLNCLMYADDIVLIGTADTIRLLLKKAERHSKDLGYRWNPLKSVVVNSPVQHGGLPLKLYGECIPEATSFSYLGIPINSKGRLDSSLLLKRNLQSASAAMHHGLKPLGLSSASFSRLTAARIYACFIRPKMEYGLGISMYLKKDLMAIEKVQDQCLRMAFGGHRTSSTAVFKHMTNLPSMQARVHTLVFKMVCRIKHLPADTLLSVITRECTRRTFHWPQLLKSCVLWSSLPARSQAILEREPDPGIIESHIKKRRQEILNDLRAGVDPPVLLSACRPKLGIDPILYLPMSLYERSRLVRWRMGWLPARPVACSRCTHGHASRRHLLSCLSVASRLGVDENATPNPLDYFLNTYLPLEKPIIASSVYLKPKQKHLVTHWPILCTIMLEIDRICHPDKDFSAASLDDTGYSLLLKWYPV